MSRQNELDRRHRGWRDLALAGVAAATVTLLLVAAVALVWLLGRSPSQAPVLAVQSQSTPTPRSLTFVRNTPTPGATAPAAVPTATAAVPTAEESSASEADTAPTAVATPEPPAVSTEPATTPPAAGGDDVVFEAPGRNELETLASGSWSVSEDTLVNPGQQRHRGAVARPLRCAERRLRGRGRDSCHRPPRVGLRSIVWTHRRLPGRGSGVRRWSPLSVCRGYSRKPA